MSRQRKVEGAGIISVGVAACAACCAGPVIGFLSAAGLLTAAGFAAFGAVAVLLLVPVAVWLVRRRGRAAACSAAVEEPVRVRWAVVRSETATPEAVAEITR